MTTRNIAAPSFGAHVPQYVAPPVPVIADDPASAAAFARELPRPEGVDVVECRPSAGGPS